MQEATGEVPDGEVPGGTEPGAGAGAVSRAGAGGPGFLPPMTSERPGDEPSADGRASGPAGTGEVFRLGIVPGVIVRKWSRVWAQRLPDVPLELVQLTPEEAAAALVSTGPERVDAAVTRVPVDREALHAIPLYAETTVVVLSKDHDLAEFDELEPADLAGDVRYVPADDVLDWADAPGRLAEHAPASTADAVELVAAGVGMLLVPQSLARLHHDKRTRWVPLAGAPTSQVVLAWPRLDPRGAADGGASPAGGSDSDGAPEPTPELVEELIGIVRGRTANSSRGRGAPAGGGSGVQGAGKDSPRNARAGGPDRKATSGSGSGSGGSGPRRRQGRPGSRSSAKRGRRRS